MQFLKSGYLYQTDHNSCGPVATLNAEIWKGKHYTNCDWEILGPRRYLLKTRHNNFPVRGTLWQDMDRVLVELNISEYMTTDINLMRSEIENGKALIVLLTHIDQKIIPECRLKSHYIFVYPNNKRIYIINGNRKYFQKWDTFYRYYLMDNPNDAEGNIYPRAWVVSK